MVGKTVEVGNGKVMVAVQGKMQLDAEMREKRNALNEGRVKFAKYCEDVLRYERFEKWKWARRFDHAPLPGTHAYGKGGKRG